MEKKKGKKPLVIGLVGTLGSGKDTAASYIKKAYGARELRFSFILVNILRLLGIKISRTNLEWLANSLRSKFGEDVLTRAMKKAMKEISEAPVIVINGIRMVPDFNWVKKLPNSKIVCVTAPAKLRWQRVRKRKEKTDDNVSFAEFKKLNNISTEVHIKDFSKSADYVIENVGSLDELHRKIDQMMKKIMRKDGKN